MIREKQNHVVAGWPDFERAVAELGVAVASLSGAGKGGGHAAGRGGRGQPPKLLPRSLKIAAAGGTVELEKKRGRAATPPKFSFPREEKFGWFRHRKGDFSNAIREKNWKN